MTSPRSAASLAALSFAALCLAGPARAVVPPDKAAAVFAEAQAICARDGGAVWGRSLCGPILLVDPDDRSVVGNQADAKGALKASGGVFVGKLPEADNIANTPTEWSGARWTELVWQMLPEGADQRHAMLAHELFHRIQPTLPIAYPAGDDNGHLDSLEGRYLLQLEWRALAAALKAPDAGRPRAAVSDALLFRSQRYALFPDAAKNEGALEANEGIAQYTGVRIGLAPEARTAFAVDSLKPYTPDATFVRSFAYATGAAYGLLLDRADPAWRTKLKSGQRFDQLLRTAMKLPASNLATVKARAAIYDDGALRTAEVKRDTAMKARAAAQHARFVEGPVLVLPMRHSNRQFNPQTLMPLGDLGTVYPTLRLVDDWGVLEVEDGALMAKDLSATVVSAAGIDASGLKGAGWKLTLKPGWTVQPGARKGDFAVAAAARRQQTVGRRHPRLCLGVTSRRPAGNAMTLEKQFARFANATARATGSPTAFLVCVASVLIWAATGPVFKYSETWQLVINTGTTIVTFLMVFLIQNTQNRDGAAIQTKLDELIRASDAENEFMGIEKLTDRELDHLHRKCERAARRSQRLLEQAAAERRARAAATKATTAAKAAGKPRRTIAH